MCFIRGLKYLADQGVFDDSTDDGTASFLHAEGKKRSLIVKVYYKNGCCKCKVLDFY